MNPNDPNNQYTSPLAPNVEQQPNSQPWVPAPPTPSAAPQPQFEPPQNPAPPLPQMPPHPAQQQSVPTPSSVPHPMVVMQEGERVLCTIKRHPIGIISAYLGGGFVVILAAAVAIFLAPRLTQTAANASQIQLAAYGVLALVAIGTAGMLAIISKVYWQNEWIVTSDSVTQVTQMSLFSRQSAQLSMENIEDVTVDQDGILQHMLNFGTLHVETAGEHSKFVFQYCPDPTNYAHQILEAREAFMNHKQYEQ